MKTRHAFGKSLKDLRKSKKVTQEDFSIVSSRTYVSTLERGQKSPTLDKVDELAKVLKIHPLSLLSLTYLYVAGNRDLDALLQRVRSDLDRLGRLSR